MHAGRVMFVITQDIFFQDAALHACSPTAPVYVSRLNVFQLQRLGRLGLKEKRKAVAYLAGLGRMRVQKAEKESAENGWARTKSRLPCRLGRPGVGSASRGRVWIGMPKQLLAARKMEDRQR